MEQAATSGVPESTDTKRQHYVPQFLLKEFAVDPERICVGMYVLSSGLFKCAVPLKRQAYEDYFYGKDGATELALGKLESQCAPVIREIVCRNRLPRKGTQAHAELLMFSILLHSRTKQHAEDTNEWFEQSVKNLFENHPEIGPHLDKVRIKLTNAPGFAVGYSYEAALLATDLRCTLLINNTSEGFLCSDNPTVFYNQFMEGKKLAAGSTGTGCKGFQAFLPISPKHCLLYFDQHIYGVGSQHQDSVDVVQSSDIRSLNMLQAINSLECLYFDSAPTKAYCDQLSQEAAHYRKASRVSVIKSPMPSRGSVHRSILTSTYADIRCALSLSFCRILKKAKAYSIGTQLIHARETAMIDLYREYQMLVGRGVRQPGTFHDFVSPFVSKTDPVSLPSEQEQARSKDLSG